MKKMFNYILLIITISLSFMTSASAGGGMSRCCGDEDAIPKRTAPAATVYAERNDTDVATQAGAMRPAVQYRNIHEAFTSRALSTVEAMINAGQATINDCNRLGQSLLHLVKVASDVTWLFEHRIDPTLKDHNDNTALNVAVSKKNEKIVRAILFRYQNNPGMHVPNIHGLTPLETAMYAAVNNPEEALAIETIIRHLLRDNPRLANKLNNRSERTLNQPAQRIVQENEAHIQAIANDFFDAIERDDIDTVGRTLAAYPVLLVRYNNTHDGFTPLYLAAVVKKNTAMTRIIVAAYANNNEEINNDQCLRINRTTVDIIVVNPNIPQEIKRIFLTRENLPGAFDEDFS